MSGNFIDFIYLLSAACFILSLKWLSAVASARRGVIVGILGMAFAVFGTLLNPSIEHYYLIAVAFVVGSAIGVPMALMPMTAVPQRTALSHAFGALAATLVGTAEYFLRYEEIDRFSMGALSVEVLLGALTVTASLMAAGKLQEILPTRPIVYPGQKFVNLSLFAIGVLLGVALIVSPQTTAIFPAMVIVALIFGVSLILPIGGADMPTVISLLNSYAGLAASAMGFVLNNKMLIIAGALDGSSGLILSIIMCKAMNRSFANVLFGAFGQVQAAALRGEEEKTYRSAVPEEAAELMRTASSIIIVPGYGMAVAHAQHKVRELYDVLTKQGIDVKFAIHPVAGRMPGHMNVLLAEADLPYDKMIEMDEANDELPQTDIALVIGANDVTNPGARTDESSPIYGMPIINVDKAQMVMVIKRSMSPGFAGIDNDLYYMDKTLMLFGDAKAYVADIVKEMSGS